MSVYEMIFFGVGFAILGWYFWRIRAVSKLCDELLKFTADAALKTIRETTTLEELNMRKDKEYWDWYEGLSSFSKMIWAPRHLDKCIVGRFADEFFLWRKTGQIMSFKDKTPTVIH